MSRYFQSALSIFQPMRSFFKMYDIHVKILLNVFFFLSMIESCFTHHSSTFSPFMFMIILIMIILLILIHLRAYPCRFSAKTKSQTFSFDANG